MQSYETVDGLVSGNIHVGSEGSWQVKEELGVTPGRNHDVEHSPETARC